MGRRDRRGSEDSLATYFFVGAVLGAIVGGMIGLNLYDNASALFHGGGIGMIVGAIVGPLLVFKSNRQ